MERGTWKTRMGDANTMHEVAFHLSGDADQGSSEKKTNYIWAENDSH